MSLSSKIEKIIFLDTVRDAKVFFNYKHYRKLQSLEGVLFIAMNPDVYVYLKQKSCNVHNTLFYFTNESHKTLLIKSESLMRWLRENIEFKHHAIGIHESYNNIFSFWSRLSIHYYLFVIEVVSNVIQAHQPKAVSAFLSPRKKVLSLWIEPQERYLGTLVNLIAKANDIHCEGIHSTSVLNLSFFPLVKSNFKFIIKYIIHYFYIHALNVRHAFCGVQETTLFTTKLYQMASLAVQFQKRKMARVCFLTSEIKMHFKVPYFNKTGSNQQKINQLENEILNAATFFSYRGISFSEILVQKIQNNILDYFMGLQVWSVAVQKFLVALKPKRVISAGNRGDDSIIAELCQNLGIECILISHGSHVKPKNEYEKIEWGEHGLFLLRAPFSQIALQSPLAEDYLDVFSIENKIIRTGPLLWGGAIDIKKRKDLLKKYFNEADLGQDTRVIVHAGTCKESNRLRFQVYETPDEYIESLRDLAYTIEKLSGIVLIIKFRPMDEITIEAIKYLIPFSKKVILSIDEPFLDVLSAADLLISFSSTCIEEALQNRVPVLLYGGRGRYQHVPATEIKPNENIKESGVYFIKRAEYLGCGITKVFEVNSKNEKTDLFGPYRYPMHIRQSIII